MKVHKAISIPDYILACSRVLIQLGRELATNAWEQTYNSGVQAKKGTLGGLGQS